MPLRIFPFVILIASSLAACSHGATSGVLPPARSEDRPAAEIYAAVVRQLVADQDTVPLDHVYVLDGPVVGAADPIRPVSRPKRPFDRALSDALAVALNDLPVQFVSERQDAVAPDPRVAGESPGFVPQGVLITLGPIFPGHDGRATVAANSFVNGLNGHWATYRVAMRDGRWRVVGTTGPLTIS